MPSSEKLVATCLLLSVNPQVSPFDPAEQWPATSKGTRKTIALALCSEAAWDGGGHFQANLPALQNRMHYKEDRGITLLSRSVHSFSAER